MNSSLLKKTLIILILLVFLSSCAPAEFGFGGPIQGLSFKMQDQELEYGEIVTTNQGWRVEANSHIVLENINYNFWYIEGE